MSRLSFVERHGRKFALAIISMSLGFTLAVVGLVLVVRAPAAADSIANIVGSFALVLGVALGAFNGANAVVEWRHGAQPSQRIERSSSETVTGGPVPTQPVTAEYAADIQNVPPHMRPTAPDFGPTHPPPRDVTGA